MTNKKRKPVASIYYGGDNPFIMGASSVIRWGDVVTINNHDIDVARAVTLGITHNIEVAHQLKKDLKSRAGLLVTFPLAYLMDALQRIPEIGTGERLLELVAPKD
jgi:hypothetical protein